MMNKRNIATSSCEHAVNNAVDTSVQESPNIYKCMACASNPIAVLSAIGLTAQNINAQTVH